ncbi:MAG: hypothetical protein ACOYL8_02870 [Patescibacteria group bacterium]
MKDLEKKIGRISRILGVPTWLVKESIGIPLESLSDYSYQAVKTAYIDSDEGSEEQRASLERLISMLATELKSSSLLRTKEIYDLALEFHINEIKVEAFHRWDDLSLEEVVEARDYKELRIAYDRTHISGSARRAAIEKRAQWAKQEFLKAHTFDKLSKACKHAPEESDIQREIIKAIYELYFKDGGGPTLE